MSDNFQKKVVCWLNKKNEPILPVQAAAGVLNCLEQLETEEWTSDEQVKQSSIRLCKSLVRGLYCMDSYDKTGLPFSKKAMSRISHSVFSLSSNDFNELLQYGHPLVDPSEKPNKKVEGFIEQMFLFDKKNSDAFLRRAKVIKKHTKITLDNITNAMRAVSANNNYPEHVEDGVIGTFRKLQACLNNAQHEALLSRNIKIFTPKDGPRSHYEMFVMGMVCLKAYDLIDHDTMVPKSLIGMGIAAFTGVVHDQLTDLPGDTFYGRMEEDLRFVSELPKKYRFGVDDFLGLMRFYAAHNKGKLTVSDHAKLESYINLTFEELFHEQMLSEGLEIVYEQKPELLESSLRLSKKFLCDYSRPSADEVADEVLSSINAKYTGHKQQKLVQAFEEARKCKPDCMDEVVLLYYQESAEFRRLRRQIFKSSRLRSGGDGPKKAFLKKVANDHRADLIRIGVSEEAIDGMRLHGKIPVSALGEQYPLTVEHINDRDYGGGNHDYNFTLMPREINAKKDWLKRVQMDLIDNKDDGFWMLSWVPKKLVDGTCPAVLDVNL